jgi:6-phospho-beta-glucosidase
MTRIGVIGGSSPFTVGLIEAIGGSDLALKTAPELELCLYGRDSRTLKDVVMYGEHHLSNTNIATTAASSLQEVLQNTDIVLLQIRYGGLAARQRDEFFATQIGCVADETLGPCGLLSAIRQKHDVLALADSLSEHCPDAIILNLINPLSLTTWLLDQRSLYVIGLCELPVTTFEGISACISRESSELDWEYLGLNHRGFITSIRTSGTKQKLVVDSESFQWPSSLPVLIQEQIDKWGAIPTKYVRLFDGGVQHTSRRAAHLQDLRADLARSIRHDSLSRPARLDERNMAWYSKAVVPVIEGWLGLKAYNGTLNVYSRGIVRERRALLNNRYIEFVNTSPSRGPYRAFLERVERHEILSMRAIERTTVETIQEALSCDGITPHSRIKHAAQLICKYASAGRDA